MKIGNKRIGYGEPTYIVAEIGINHNGSLQEAYRLISAAAVAGCDAVKFQKRTDMDSVIPKEMIGVMYDTPWGETMPYEDYRAAMEFTVRQYQQIESHCRHVGIDWFYSPWDLASIGMMEGGGLDTKAIKIPSAHLTNDMLLDMAMSTGKPMIVSTGMSTWGEVMHAETFLMDHIKQDNAIFMHCHSAYPAPEHELNLSVIPKMIQRYGMVGYSGHEVGLSTTLAAVALGACVIERHITMDRSQKGSDHAASVEPQGFIKLVKWIRSVERAMGEPYIKVWESELPARKKLRGY